MSPGRNACANGEMMGRAARVALRRRMARLRRFFKKQRVSDRLLRARVREFAGIIRKIAPRWLDEVKGMADGAGVSAEDILAVDAAPATAAPSRGRGCTSFVAVGRPHNMLFKIRDNRNETQAFFVNYAPRTGFYQAGTDIGNLGVAHMFNSRGVAGACNTGSPTSRVSDDPRFDDCHILRYFAENATCVEDVPRLLECLLQRNAAGGASPTRGCIFLLADREKGLLLETHSTDYSARFIEKGKLVVSNHFVTPKGRSWESEPPNENVRARRRRMQDLLAKYRGQPTVSQVFAISRDRQAGPHHLCNDDKARATMTVSAQLQVIPRESPDDSVNYVCCGNTRHSLYVPVPLGWTQNFVPLLSGRFYMNADRLYRKYSCGGHFRKVQKAFEKDALARTDCGRLFKEAYALVRRER